MIDTATARMFPAQNRSCTETESLRSVEVWCANTGVENSLPVLRSFRDITLGGNEKIELITEATRHLLLLPTVGKIIYGEEPEVKVETEAGAILMIPTEGRGYIANPYASELVNFLQIELAPATGFDQCRQWPFDLRSNEPVPLCEASGYRILITRMDGRQEQGYRPQGRNSGLFVFVIEGAFEVQHRLLETRDALAISGVEALEFEALSNNAVLLLIEDFTPIKRASITWASRREQNCS